MELNEYQNRAMTTCMPSCDNLAYMLFNLQGEVGELSGKFAKMIRKGQFDFVSRNEQKNLMCFTNLYYNGRDFSKCDTNEAEELQAIKGELGDVLWQLSGLCKVLGFPLEEIGQSNLDKLKSRQQRGVIDGNGDNR